MYYLWYRIESYKKWFCIIHTGRIMDLWSILSKWSSPKTFFCILFSKLFCSYSFDYGCSTKFLSNIFCPNCLTNPSLISLLFYEHFVITFFNFIEDTSYGKKLSQPSWIHIIVIHMFWIPSYFFDSFAFVVCLKW